MSLETEVAALTAATTELLNEVNVKKATLDAVASSAVSSHASGTGVHSIAGVTGLQTALDAKEASGTAAATVAAHVAASDPHPGYVLESTVGAAGGVAPLDGTGKVASTYLPSFVDDVVEAADFAALPGTGEAGKIYVTLDNNKSWRWSGSAYVEIQASPGSTDAVPEGVANLWYTDARVRAVTLTGLGSGSNTPIAATDGLLTALALLQAQVSARQATLVSGLNIKTINGISVLGSGDLPVGAAPGGSNTQVAFNDGGVFGGDAGMTYDKATDTLTLGGDVYAGAGKGFQFTGANTGFFAINSYMWGLKNNGSYRLTSSLDSADRVWCRGIDFGSADYFNGGNATLTGPTSGQLDITNGTAGQYRDLALRSLLAYGPYTDSSNYERLAAYYDSTDQYFRIGLQKAGTGQQRVLQLFSGPNQYVGVLTGIGGFGGSYAADTAPRNSIILGDAYQLRLNVQGPGGFVGFACVTGNTWAVGGNASSAVAFGPYATTDTQLTHTFNPAAKDVGGLYTGAGHHMIVRAGKGASGNNAGGHLSVRGGEATGSGAEGRVFLRALASAPTDGDMANADINFYLDEGTNKLMVRVKYSGGTLKTGEVALT